ncbi:MAG: YgiT-type zinc finger protein [Anaerolinea sp.]|nr:YgiT-type zinc finger protein [Anaerolinea sp.]
MGTLQELSCCLVCKGKLRERQVTRMQEYGGHWYLIENLPALVCEQCGETYYTPQAHDRVIDLITGGAEPVRVETVAVLDASA